MKNKIWQIFLCISMLSTAQNIKKSKFVVMPGDNWMSQNGYLEKIENQGAYVDSYDYARALQENFELTTAISTVEDVLKERGLQVENMAEKLKGIAKSNAENMLMTSKSGSTNTVSGYDRFMNSVKPDIIVYVEYQIVENGPKKIMNLRLNSNDAYTYEPIGAKNSSTAPTFSPDTNLLVRESIASIIDPFMSAIENHVNDIFENGRKVKIEIKKFDAWDGDFEKEYDGKEFKEIIESWFSEKAYKGVYSLDSPSENAMDFIIRIPLLDEAGKGTNATTYGRLFQKFLKAPPYAITAKVREIGIGRCVIQVGEK
jgi:hypothetical protein